ncbi:tyrosine-protein phosphatase [Gordonia sp. TBRC 11910]|uniref:Tyrosine-protein phosphatase n=1 Tax=Gordonia asplenii TaxID=2725283 RepID=A0A848KNN1_9ACTN|nr:tyrosine-protein phosphatase [Gordonia asplenii]NMN99889.1 tyrosine-protein phosphatase [Gordonia asplenii]
MKSSSLRKTLTAATVVAALLGAPALVAVPAAAAPKSTIVAPTRLIKLDGTQNTRTFDGITTRDGKSISSLVIRSDNLSKLTAADKATLAKRRVATIIDLRTAAERALQPDHVVPGATLHYDDVLGATPPTTLIDLTSAYRAFVTDAQARAQFATALRTITTTVAAGDSVIFHCTAGKDRTGWAAALILTIAGVDRATVDSDYLASNIYRHATPNDPLNGVNLNLLNTSFSTANRVYGSFDNYVRKGLGLTPAEVTALRNAVRVPLRVY